jgi:hypothetical protein
MGTPPNIGSPSYRDYFPQFGAFFLLGDIISPQNVISDIERVLA